MRGKIDWDDALPTLSKALPSKPPPPIIYQESKNISYYKCPKCNKLESESHSGLDIRNLDNKLKCTHCNKSSVMWDWGCECSIRWFLCERHGTLRKNTENRLSPGSTQRRKSSASGEDTNSVKRACVHRSFDLLLAEDISKYERPKSAGTKRKASVSLDSSARLGVPRLLGPILANRFKDLHPRVTDRL